MVRPQESYQGERMDERSARTDDQGAGEQADRMERETERMDERSSELGKDIEGQRSNWESKQQEDAVPGAQTEESLASDVPQDDAEGTEDSDSDGDSSPPQKS